MCVCVRACVRACVCVRVLMLLCKGEMVFPCSPAMCSCVLPTPLFVLLAAILDVSRKFQGVQVCAQREGEGDTHTDTHSHKHTQTHRHTNTHTQTHRHTNTHTNTQTHTLTRNDNLPMLCRVLHGVRRRVRAATSDTWRKSSVASTVSSRHASSGPFQPFAWSPSVVGGERRKELLSVCCCVLLCVVC